MVKEIDKYSQMKKNSVKAEGQMNGSALISYINKNGLGLKVLFVGNSITKHNVRKEIGWDFCHGMAASSVDKDYVHLVATEVGKLCEDATFCVCQVSNWEREYIDGFKNFELFEEARNFDADIIVIRFIENCVADIFDAEVFKEEYLKFLNYLNKSGKSKFILTSGFWRHPGDDSIKEISQKFNYEFIELGDLGDNDEMKAIGLFEHDGVANHPGDKGMEEIANRIVDKINNLINNK